jgi:transposase
VPALQPCVIEPIWEQFSALLPKRDIEHPLGCHRLRIPDRTGFEKLVEVLVFGCAYWRIADESCSATTLRRRRDEWIEGGLMDELRQIALKAYDRTIGLGLSNVAVDGCITKAPSGGEKAGRSPVDRGKQGIKRSSVVDAEGIPLGTVAASANRHDSPLLGETLDTLEVLGPLPEQMRVHLDRGYDSKATRQRLEERGLIGVIAEKGKPSPLRATKRWVVERTNSWHNAHKKLVWCTERRGRVVDFWIAFSEVIMVVRRLIREAWTRYRWKVVLSVAHDLLAQALSRFRRADERTRTADLTSLRVRGQGLLRVARVCQSRIENGGSLFPVLLTVAGYCVRVRVKIGSRELPTVCCVLHRIALAGVSFAHKKGRNLLQRVRGHGPATIMLL